MLYNWSNFTSVLLKSSLEEILKLSGKKKGIETFSLLKYIFK